MRQTSDLEMLIALAYSEGFSRFGDLRLDQQVYSSRIQNVIREHLGGSAQSSAITPFMLRLYASDLYLATACAQQAVILASAATLDLQVEYSRLAWKVFSATYKEFIGELARLFTGHDQSSPDLTNAALDYFLLPDDSGTSRISLYDGRSSLYTWLRVVVRQASDELLRSGSTAEIEGPEVKTKQPARANIEQFKTGNPGRSVFTEAVSASFYKLTPKERLLLLWHYKDELPMEKIATLLGMHELRTRRFLERTLVKLASEVRETLGDKHRLSANDIEGFIREIAGPDRAT
jgi:RNA polymerase sigma factor (sigma-70 family)